MPDHLKQFFAVTETSLYVAVSRDESEPLNAPVLEKLAMRDGAVSKAPVGTRHVGWCSPFFRIKGNFFQMCCGWDDSHHEAYTPSNIVALFLDVSEARECLKVDDAEVLDTRWRDHTVRVLRTIGDDHPIFHVWWEDFPKEYLNQLDG